FDRIRQRQGARSDTDDPLTIVLAKHALDRQRLAGSLQGSGFRPIISLSQCRAAVDVERRRAVAPRTGPAPRPRPGGAADGNRWQIEHYRAGTPRARSKPREATHARQEHSLRQG